MRLDRLQTWLFRLCIASLAFSFQPVFDLGKSFSLNVEIGAVQIIGGLFILAMLPSILKHQRFLLQQKAVIVLLAYMLVVVVSVLLSKSIARSVSLATYTVFLTALVVAFVEYLRLSKKHIQEAKVLLVGVGLFSAVFGLWQFIGDGLGVSRSLTRLLPEYTSVVFGFPRPQGLLAEPQYLASLLVVSIGSLMMLQKESQRNVWPVALLLWSVLWLTLSRGAFVSIIVLFVFLAIFANKSRITQLVVRHALTAVLGFTVALLLVGWAGQMYMKDNQNFTASIQRYLEHASLSVIDFPDPPQPKKDSSDPTPTAAKTNQDLLSSNIKDTAGEVEASRIGRLKAADLAFDVFNDNPKNVLIGVGVGGFGPYVQAKDATYDATIVVNNQPLNILVETGLLGFVLFGLFIIAPSRLLWSQMRKADNVSRSATILLALLIATHMQYLFFSTLTNVTHIWVLYALMLAITLPKKQPDAQ